MIATQLLPLLPKSTQRLSVAADRRIGNPACLLLLLPRLGLYAGIEAGEGEQEARYLGTADIAPKYLGTAGISRAYDGTASIGPTYLGTAGVNQ